MKAWKYLQTNRLPLGRKFVSGENHWAMGMMRKKCRTFYKMYGLYSLKLSRMEKAGKNHEAMSDCRDHNQYDMHFLGWKDERKTFLWKLLKCEWSVQIQCWGIRVDFLTWRVAWAVKRLTLVLGILWKMFRAVER